MLGEGGKYIPGHAQFKATEHYLSDVDEEPPGKVAAPLCG